MELMQNQNHFEEIVIASSIQNADNFFKAKNKGLSHLDFKNPEFQETWKKMDLVSTGIGISPLSITEQYKYTTAEGRERTLQRLQDLEEMKVNPVDIDLSLSKLREYSGMRALKGLSDTINSGISDGATLEELLARVTSELFGINSNDENIQEFNAFESVNETSKEIKQRMAGTTSDGVSSGISTLDEEIRCFYYALATIVIGRPGHGKTTLMINTFVNNIRNGDTPVFISLEMPAVHVVIKMLSIWTKIKINKIFDPTLLNENEKQILRDALVELSQKEFYIVDAVSMTITELGMILLKYTKLGCKVAYLDYIQLLKMANGQIPNTAAEFRAVFKQFREILRQINRYGEIASVVGAQAGRSVESRPIEERIPQMSDLEWSSSLEQDAAVIIGIMNREKYEGEECEYKNQVFLGFPKHRYENAIRVNLAFLGNIQLMADLADPNRHENVPETWRRQVEREEQEREEARQREVNAEWSDEMIISNIQTLLSEGILIDEDNVRDFSPQLYAAIMRSMGSIEEALNRYQASIN